MNLKKLILTVSGLGVLTMLFVSVNFYIEKNKSMPMTARQTANNEQKVAFRPAENQEQKQEQKQEAPNITPQTMLPENIPPAMLKAMQEKGLTVEDLQKNSQTKQNMPSMQNMPKGKAFPEEMLKAIAAQEEQNKQQAQETQAQDEKNADPVQKAVDHIKNHSDAATVKHLEHSLVTLKENPGDETALGAVTEIFIGHNEIQGAEALLQRGIISAPNNAVLPFLYGQVLAHNSQFEKTAEQWERALSLQDSAELRYSLGVLYRYQLNKENLAKEQFNKAKTLPHHDPKLAELLNAELGK